MFVIPDARTTMFVSGGIASEPTLAEFITGASAKEVKIYNEYGTAVPAYGESFFITYKDKNGVYLKTPTIKPQNIKYANVINAITPIPTYTYFDVSVTNMAAGDLLDIMVQVYGFSTSSWHQRVNKVVTTPFASGDTTNKLAYKAGITLQESLAKIYEGRPAESYVYNKAGYKAIFETEADAVAGVGGLTNADLVWVIANNKPYTYDTVGNSFATYFTEKTDWSSEITADTAEVTLNCKYFYVVQKAGSTNSLYVICRSLSEDDERKFGYESPVYVGAQWKDASNSYAKADIGVTRVAERLNPGDGKYIRDFEVAVDRINRPYGRFQKLGETPVLAADTATSYYVLNLCYYVTEGTSSHQLGFSENYKHLLMIPFTTEADADNFLAAIELTRTASTPAGVTAEITAAVAAVELNDLADVVITNGTTGDIIQLAADGDWKNVASDV